MILTVSEAERDLRDAVAAGTAGYLLKNTPSRELYDALALAAAGEPVFSPSLAALVLGEFRRLAPTAGATPLTDQEREVLQLIAQGRSNKEIATELKISERTVKTNVSNIFGKLELTDRTQVALYAHKRGLAQLAP